MNLQQFCSELQISESYVASRKFDDLKENFKKRNIIITKQGRGKNAEYEIIKENDNYEKIPEIEGYPKISLSKVASAKNLVGEKFDRLTVLYRTAAPDNVTTTNINYWLCKCSCEEGKYTVASTNSLTRGKTSSCGCKQREKAREVGSKKVKDLLGEKFGHLTVIQRAENYVYPSGETSTQWLCECDCKKHTKIIVLRNNLVTGHTTSCGCLIKSKGEEKIIKILSDANIFYLSEFSFRNCNNGKSRFDFYLPDNNYLIEYDGMQHFSYTGYDWNTKENFIETQKRDEIKNQWCKENNIPLIRIPYTRYNELCLKDLLLETTNYRVV